MHRRSALTGLAITAGLATTAAFSKTANAAATGDAEATHIADTAKVGTMSLAASRIAEAKASHPKVKEFAKLETAEQETVSDVLKDLQSPDQASGTMTVPTDAEVAAKLSADDKAAVDALDKLSGKAFDKAYIKAQIDGHTKLLDIQQTYLKVGKDVAHLAVAKLASGAIKEHLQHLHALPDAL